MSNKSTDIEDLLQLAKEDVQRNRLASAEKYLAQAILINNQISEAFYLMALVYTKRGKLNKAIMAFEKTLAMDPFHTEAAIALSSLHNDMGHYEEGALVYERAKKRLDRVMPGFDPRINEDLAKKHSEIGKVYLRYERFEEALEEFTKANALQPQNDQYIVKRAHCLSRLDQKGKAIELLSKLVENRPDCIDARISLGVLYHTQQRLSEAQSEWQKALSLDPEHPGAQMYMSMVENASKPSPLSH